MTASANDWSKQRLKWCFTSCKNGVWGDEPDGDNDVPVVRVADFNRVNFTVDFSSPTLRSIKETELESNGLSSGDLLLEKSGGGENQLVGTVVGFDFDGPAVCSNFVAKLSVAEGFNSRFLVYLNAALYDAKINLRSIKQTTGIQNLDSNAYLDEVVSLPDYLTQQTIALYLDRETSAIDTLISEKESMLGLLEEKRQALVSHAVTQGLDPKAKMKPTGIEWLGDVPSHWELWRLKFLATVQTGLTIGKNYGNQSLDEYYYLRVANVQDGYLNLDKMTTVQVTKSDAESCLLQAGDVLMNEGGDIDKLGRGCVWQAEVSPCLHQNHVFCVRPHGVDANWLTTFTASTAAKMYFETRAKRTTNLASISSSNIRELTVPMPPASEQEEILKHLNNLNQRLDEVREATELAIKLLKERRSALITAAVTGQIPIEDMAT